MFALNNNDPLLHWVKKSQLSNGLLLSIKSQTMEDLFKNKVEVSQQWAAVINSGRMLTSKILCKLPPAVNNSGPLFDWIWPFIICPLLLTTNLSWPQLRVKVLTLGIFSKVNCYSIFLYFFAYMFQIFVINMDWARSDLKKPSPY